MPCHGADKLRPTKRLSSLISTNTVPAQKPMTAAHLVAALEKLMPPNRDAVPHKAYCTLVYYSCVKEAANPAPSPLLSFLGIPLVVDATLPDGVLCRIVNHKGEVLEDITMPEIKRNKQGLRVLSKEEKKAIWEGSPNRYDEDADYSRTGKRITTEESDED